MPTLFADRMLEDVAACIQETDILAPEAKSALLSKVRMLHQQQCTQVSTCRECSEHQRCENRICAVLNGDDADAPRPAPLTRWYHYLG